MNISDKDLRIRPKIGGVLGIHFSMASLFFTIVGYSQIDDGMRSNYWPTVSGVVLSSKVNVSSTSSTVGSTIRSYTFTPHIRYFYVANGLAYGAKKLQFIQDGTGGTGRRKK